MTPATLAALCVTLTMGRTQAQVIAAAIKNAIAAHRAQTGRDAQ
jgi:hypothetical protein